MQRLWGKVALGLSIACGAEQQADEWAPPSVVRTQESYVREFAARLQSCVDDPATKQSLLEVYTMREILERGAVARAMIEELEHDLSGLPEGSHEQDADESWLIADTWNSFNGDAHLTWRFARDREHQYSSWLLAERCMPRAIVDWNDIYGHCIHGHQEMLTNALRHYKELPELYRDDEEETRELQAIVGKILGALPRDYVVDIAGVSWQKTECGEWKNDAADCTLCGEDLTIQCMQSDGTVAIRKK